MTAVISEYKQAQTAPGGLFLSICPSAAFIAESPQQNFTVNTKKLKQGA